MSETLEERLRRNSKEDFKTRKITAYASDVVELLDEKDSLIASLRAELAKREKVVEAARKFIDVSVCDPDITSEMWEAWNEYQDALKGLE